jgi:hypothetical protein
MPLSLVSSVAVLLAGKQELTSQLEREMPLYITCRARGKNTSDIRLQCSNAMMGSSSLTVGLPQPHEGRTMGFVHFFLFSFVSNNLNISEPCQ